LGFKPAAVAFAWVKLNRRFAAQPGLFYSERDFFFGLGLTTRKNIETCILGRRGKPQRLATDVFEIILAPVREHSRKPDEAYCRIERFCGGPYLELFARSQRENWTSWGDQLPNASDSVRVAAE
jgi:N6-adenosine-specific RNA methylase IME4